MRTLQVAEMLHKKLAQLLLKVRDPRLGMVTIYQVKVTPDLRNAKVYISVFEEDKIQSSLLALNHAKKFLRANLRGVLKLKFLPELSFYFDNSSHQAFKIDKLLASI